MNKPNGPDVAGDRTLIEDLPAYHTKWAVPALLLISAQALRFSQLERQMGPVSRKTLTETLRLLERDGFVCRTVHPTSPPSVEYSITILGRSAARAFSPMVTFVQENRDLMVEARHHYDISHRK